MKKYAPNGKRICNPSTGEDLLVIDFVQYVLGLKREKNKEISKTEIGNAGTRGEEVNSELLGTEVLSIPAPNIDIDKIIAIKEKQKETNNKVLDIQDIYAKKEAKSKVKHINDIYAEKENKENAR